MSSAPTVYFIDDSATMREVIKIAFRRENINVIACHDAASAFTEIEQTRPDVVITDVIMPDKDGYEVCQYIKQHPKFATTPVILMSGVVNKSVAEKAFSVKADELIRKPFQPQDLIARVRHLLRPATAVPPPSPAVANAALSSIFGAAAAAAAAAAPVANGGQTIARRIPTPPPAAPPAVVPSPLVAAFSQPAAAAPAAAAARPAPAPVPPSRPAAASPASMDVQKLKFEIMRLETLVKKLQTDLESERQYSRALEEHVKTLQESE